jgi:hypothetical protein
MSNILLLHCNTSFSDASGEDHIVTANGNAQISAAQSKFGSGSALFDGSGDWLDLDGDSDFAFGASDFTIDFWLRPTSSLVGSRILFDARVIDGAFPVIYASGGIVRFHTNSADQITGTTVLSLDTWHHVALTRSGTSTRLFVNGTQEGSTYVDSNSYGIGASRPRIGASGPTGLGEFQGWIDEIRIANTAVWTAAFSVPTEEYFDPFAWPAALPQCPILNAFTEQRQRNVVAFTPEVGRPKMRRRSTAAQVLTNVAFRMSTTELATFNTFYVTTLADGTLPFSWAHPVTQTTHDWVFSQDQSPTIERFAPAHHRVSFQLVRLD